LPDDLQCPIRLNSGQGSLGSETARDASTTTTAAVTVAVSFGRYHSTTLTSPDIFSIIDGCIVTGITYLSNGSGRAIAIADAETTEAAKNPILITQKG
uniref:Capsid protein n=1 Tax=Romanomermis culicivorax TaxID=13658 RepID=A0A915JYZ9_ROMCU